MANFATHVNVAAMVSGISVIGLNYVGIVDKENMFLYFIAGTIGGILPDIDHDKAIPLKIMQFFFSNLFAFLVTSRFVGEYPIWYLVPIWVVSYFMVVGAFYLFKQFTNHRGIIHSIPFAFLTLFSSTILSYYFFGMDIKSSYLVGIFMFIGFITHLLLDEIYSVDISGMKMKKSFGSAMKFYSRNPRADLVIYLLLIVEIWILPYKAYFIKLIRGIINV